VEVAAVAAVVAGVKFAWVVVACKVGFVIRFWIIFSSINARTLTLAVCKGGPFESFLSVFFASES
jgi:hypothetical protein